MVRTWLNHLKDISQIGLSPPMLSGLKKGSQPLKSDGQDMETLLQWRPLFWLEFGTSFEGLKPCRQTVSRYVYVIYIYYILYIYFDTWKILEKTSAFLEKTHPFFAAKNRVFSYRPESVENHRSPRVGFPRHPRNGSYLNGGKWRAAKDDARWIAKKYWGGCPCGCDRFTIVRESKLVFFSPT